MICYSNLAQVQLLCGWKAGNFFSIILLQKLLVCGMLITCGKVWLEMNPKVEKTLVHSGGSFLQQSIAACSSDILHRGVLRLI